MAAITPVLLKGAEGATLLRIPVSSSDTVASLKAGTISLRLEAFDELCMCLAVVCTQ